MKGPERKRRAPELRGRANQPIQKEVAIVLFLFVLFVGEIPDHQKRTSRRECFLKTFDERSSMVQNLQQKAILSVSTFVV